MEADQARPPLTELNAADLHTLGLERLEKSLETIDVREAARCAGQAQALFFAAISAGNLAERTGRHAGQDKDGQHDGTPVPSG